MNRDRIEFIKQMEIYYDNSSEKLQILKKDFATFKENLEQYYELINYYHSQQWLDDFELSNNQQLPQHIKCGVLSEDAIYDLMGEYFHFAIEMLETATQLIKQE